MSKYCFSILNSFPHRLSQQRQWRIILHFLSESYEACKRLFSKCKELTHLARTRPEENTTTALVAVFRMLCAA